MELNFDTQIFRWLRRKGFSSYLVGNKVRGLLLKKEDDREDFDIATSALPLELVKVFRTHRLTPVSVDEKFGLVTIKWEGVLYEFTTFRRDIYTQKDLALHSRYPSKIEFVKSIAEDALRRDLTINAIYFDTLAQRFQDPVGGLDDWKRKLIREIGDPLVRFREDPIRILRAVRFKNSLGFRYHPRTLRALKACGGSVKYLSFSVRQKEFKKMQELDIWPKIHRELGNLGILPRI